MDTLRHCPELNTLHTQFSDFRLMPRHTLPLAVVLFVVASLHAAVPDFRKDIEPLLVEHCIKCHGPEKQKGGLRLDQKAAALIELSTPWGS